MVASRPPFSLDPQMAFLQQSSLVRDLRRLVRFGEEDGAKRTKFKRMKIDWDMRFLFLVTSAFALSGVARIEAASLNGARITYVSNDVRLEAAAGGTHVSAGDIVSGDTTINNGVEARSELTFGNRSIVRLGANTVLKLEAAPGAMELREGGMLFQIPKRSKATISTASMVVTGKQATGLLERNGDAYIKLLLLEGEVRVALRHRIGESIVLKPGQILITGPKATALPEAAYFDIARAVSTCRLISDFPPLSNQDSIARAARKQARLTKSGDYIPSNLVIFGRGTLVNLVPPQPSDNVTIQKHTSKPQPAN